MLLVSDKLLDEETIVASVTLFERRRLKSVWKEAMDERRLRELRRGSDAVSLDPLLREGMLVLWDKTLSA